MNLYEHEESLHELGDFRFNAIKLTPPALTQYAFKRPLPPLDELSPSIKLVLFGAPAGFGKTTAMLQWLQRLNSNGVNTGWLTLDSNDNDTGRFISHAVVALNSCNQEFGQETIESSLFNVQNAHLGSLLDAIDNLSLMGKPFALFLDDYEFITNRTVHTIVNQLIGRMPAGSRLVIGTRVTPPLGIGKLRAREQLFEVGADLLCFSPDEARHYLTEVRGLQLSDRVLAELYSSTEGWAVAIQLASLAMIGQQNPEKAVRNFSGNQSAIADYLAEDVLSRQTDETQDFLLKTSILDNLNPEICSALTGRADSGALLNQIEKANLFLTAFGDNDNSYRYHNLFLSFLRYQLSLRYPEILVGLHDRAAQWYTSEGFLIKALEHALSAGNQATAVSLLEQVAETLLDGGQMATLIRYVKMLPGECVAGTFRTRIAYIWALIFSHCYQEAKLELATLSFHEGDMTDILRDEYLTLGPCLLLWTDCIDECIALAQENLSKISKDSHFASGALLNIFTICLSTQGRFSEVIELSASAKNHMAHVNRELGLLHSERVNAVASFAPGRLRSARVGLVYSRCVDGIISFTQGRLRAAREQFETAFRFASQRNRYSSSSAVAAIYLAETWYEENNLVAAEEMLREYLTLIRQTGLPDHIISAHRILGRIAITQDKLAEAHFQLREMESLGLERGLGRVVSSARLEKARLALIQGDLELAEHVFHQEETAKEWGKAISGVPHANELDDSKLFKIRLLIKRGNGAEALNMVHQELKIIPQTTTSRRGLLLKLLTAVAMYCSGDELVAQKNLVEVLEFVALEGNKRLIADEHYLLGDLFRTLLNNGINLPPGVDLLLKELAGDLESSDEAAEAELSPPTQAAVDELTRRELQVLTLVAEGLTNRDMANKLFLSEVTIKTHMRNISSKLGVHSRTQAIIIARKRNLI